jgi:hypothetical protein
MISCHPPRVSLESDGKYPSLVKTSEAQQI